MVDQAGESPQQARLARPDLPEEQHEFAGVHREVDPLDAAGAVVVDGADVTQLELAQRTFKDASDTLKDGRGSLVRTVDRFTELGVKVVKRLPASADAALPELADGPGTAEDGA